MPARAGLMGGCPRCGERRLFTSGVTLDGAPSGLLRPLKGLRIALQYHNTAGQRRLARE
jgi:uncharacterized protein (DUF983 family)